MPTAPRTRGTRTPKEVPVKEAEALLGEQPVTKKEWKMNPSTLILGLLLVVALGAAGYFYHQSKNAAQVAQAKEIEELVARIGEFLVLPENETPTLATVTDREKLADQTFFAQAENGDKVLIYSQSGKAILFRPSTGKVVDVTTVNVNQPSGGGQNTEAQPSEENAAPEPETMTQALTVALYNGSTTVGVTDTTEKQITAGIPGVAVILKEKAVKNDYQGVLVVDQSGKNSERATALATLLGGTVGSLPAGEGAPQADIVVIVGNQTETETAEEGNN